MPSSSSIYKLVEPHPQATTPYIHTARGGAGNVASAKSTTDGSNATGPASRHPSLSTPRRTVFTSGRGGAGNLHTQSDRAIFSFDEELEREMRQTQDLAPVCYVGRGGAGNKFYVDQAIQRVEAADSDSAVSTSSSECDTAPDTLNRKLKKGWGKVIALF
ncbi:hypothetical protein GJ744_009266 [Endocarpon pusillum]|uniref:Uncharacterized protein n=1 Tax=Endocarpon pusillum TaxID=364733 RepID=A0A8H7AG06_9EURO|nr:hypothetical protein GJ744_009266 [Endocarpon pusillum]